MSLAKLSHLSRALYVDTIFPPFKEKSWVSCNTCYPEMCLMPPIAFRPNSRQVAGQISATIIDTYGFGTHFFQKDSCQYCTCSHPFQSVDWREPPAGVQHFCHLQRCTSSQNVQLLLHAQNRSHYK